MEITIKIPKEFEEHFNSDRFEDSLQRCRYDIKKARIRKETTLSGRYEIELLDMLTEAFSNGTPLPKGHGKLIDENELKKEAIRCEWSRSMYGMLEHTLSYMKPIIEAERSDSE